MTLTNHPLDTLSLALNAALWRDLPPLSYMERDWEAYAAWKKNVEPTLPRDQRHYAAAEAAKTMVVRKQRRPTTQHRTRIRRSRRRGSDHCLHRRNHRPQRRLRVFRWRPSGVQGQRLSRLRELRR